MCDYVCSNYSKRILYWIKSHWCESTRSSVKIALILYRNDFRQFLWGIFFLQVLQASYEKMRKFKLWKFLNSLPLFKIGEYVFDFACWQITQTNILIQLQKKSDTNNNKYFELTRHQYQLTNTDNSWYTRCQDIWQSTKHAWP